MQPETEINGRLSMLVKHLCKGNAAAFARSIRVTQQRFDRLLKSDKKSGKYPMVKPEMIETILAKYPTVNKVWLHTGLGPTFNALTDPHPDFLAVKQSGVPYFAVDFVHECALIQSGHTPSIHCHIDIKMFNHADFWCNVSGQAMNPHITPGDIVAMKEVSERETGIVYGEIYGIVTNHFCIVRRVAKGSSSRCLKLIPSNKSAEYAEQEQEMPWSAIERIYQVLCVVKKL